MWRLGALALLRLTGVGYFHAYLVDAHFNSCPQLNDAAHQLDNEDFGSLDTARVNRALP
jgi:hypothetical protein